MRRPDPSLSELLFDEPYLFDFFQAVRLLEKITEGGGPVGHDVTPARESVRFIADLGLKFTPSPIANLEPGVAPVAGGEKGPPRMTTAFLGLIGAAGALPTVYTQELIELKRERRLRGERRPSVALGFLDLFHHRLISLYYRAWQKYNVPSLWMSGDDDPDEPTGSDAFSRHIFDFIGLGSSSLRNRQAVADGVIAYYAGFFVQQHRPAVSLELLLADHFGKETRVIPFFGQWLTLQEDQQSRMGRSGAFNCLGIDTVVGRNVWDDQSKFRVRIGPLGLDEFLDFLPGGRLVDELMDLIRLFVRGELDFDVQLVLKAADVPWCRLSSDPASAARLGQTSWLRSQDFVDDKDDSIIRPNPLGASRSRSPL
jgi:type VI secretion system protein ImpH